jgi:two-component system chemotaxis response regulator CheB
MIFRSELYLKWFDLDHPEMVNADFTFTNTCILLSLAENKKFDGFTVFEPRNFNQEFVNRLQRRDETSKAIKKYVLYVPDFIKHRKDEINWGSLGDRVTLKNSPFIHLKKFVDGFFVRDRMRVVSVDDSPVLLKFLSHAMGEMGFVDVVAQTSEPMDAVSIILKLNPDVVTMDIQMPKKTGVEVVKDLLAAKHFNVIMISSLTPEEGPQVFDALNLGAFDYLQKPKLENKEVFSEDLKSKLLLASAGTKPKKVGITSKTKSAPLMPMEYSSQLIWCIGASTGGTQALTQVMTSLPTKIPPTLIVQHIPPVFSKSFADSLNNLCPFTVKEAEDGEIVKTNCVYIAPGGLQMGVRQLDSKLYISLSDSEPVNRFKPSVDYLFNNIATLKGFQVIAGILTGMGKDGAAGLLRLKQLRAQTFAQDEASSAVFGMPRAAIELGAADKVVAIDEVAQALLSFSQHRRAS